jgi:adenylate cyclase
VIIDRRALSACPAGPAGAAPAGPGQTARFDGAGALAKTAGIAGRAAGGGHHAKWRANLASERVERRLTAILAADIAGYSRLMGADEEGTLAAVKAVRRELVDPGIEEHRGRIVKTTGDGLLAEFASVVDAMRCAVALQRAMAKRNAGKAPENRIEFRIGVNVGDIILDDGDIFGDGVNVAARLEALAEPGGICVSARVQEDVRGKLDIALVDTGEHQLKNIAWPVRVYRVDLAAETPPRPALALPDKPSIAVLPFDTMSGERDLGYLADAIVEAITAALSCIRSFFVIARNSAFTYKGKAANVRDVGNELGVAYVLEGSVQKAGARIRIIVQLIETEGGAHVWAGRYDGTTDDIFDLQDRITEQVAGALQPSIRIAEVERARRKRPQDLGAYGYTMRAMPHVWALEKEESGKALDLLDKALAIDSDYPLALSLAGWCHAQRSVYQWTQDIGETRARALSLAERAAAISSDDPLILAVLGAIHTFIRNYGTARVLLERALSIDPNAAWAWTRLGWLDNYADRPEQAIEKFERALRLSPLDPANFNNHVGIGSAHEVAERYDQAAAMYRRALEEQPHALWIYRNLASSLAGAGRMAEAREAYAQVMRAYPDLTAAKFRQAMVFSSTTLDRIVANLQKLGLPA